MTGEPQVAKRPFDGTPSKGRATWTLVLGILGSLPFFGAVIIDTIIINDSPSYAGMGLAMMGLGLGGAAVPLSLVAIWLGAGYTKGKYGPMATWGFAIPLVAYLSLGVFWLIANPIKAGG
ncbi:hypothetical protein EG850_06110 [Gulosibacter macacae]|uniref:Uncharacterized protein n=1 Tax=Gulosibacter macacae TaxID=2488791 RepID=A0A3P3VZC6_9MICO|nr:hypothetical protein [Gulosibacter macacae]RRJ86976.1 hypothetical protein EG850_06110 [Gulosibacter macacae]